MRSSLAVGQPIRSVPIDLGAFFTNAKETTMSNDSDLKQAVLDELKWEPSVDAAHIGVTAKGGVVSLMGHVDAFTEKSAAERAAWRVKGVKAVAEEIEVRLPVHIKRNDEEIAAAAINRMAWDVSVPADVVKVKVQDGWVTLTGAVDWHYQKEAAEQDIRNLFGVVGVSNQIGVNPHISATNVSESIMHALHRSWFDPKTIKVSAEGGRIKLSGTANSWYDRSVAGTTAWAAPGATNVENNISIV